VDVDIIKAYLDNSKNPVRHIPGWAQLFARPDKENYRTIDGIMSCYAGIVKDGQWVLYKPITCKDCYLYTIKILKWDDTYKKYWEEYGYPTFPAEEEGKNALNFSDFGITGHD
jgi:hypothetical protein